jgi:hypothetical protein
MDDGDFVEADDSAIGGGGPTIIPSNWLQHFESVVDPCHVPLPRSAWRERHGKHIGPATAMSDETILGNPRNHRETNGE